MLSHYLLITYRNFKRDKYSFLINLFGLTAGLTCTLLIFLWVDDELQKDSYHTHDARLFQVMEHQHYADNILTTTSTPGLLGETLKEEVPEVELAANITWVRDYTVTFEDKNVGGKGLEVGTDYFRIFTYEFLEGNPEFVLKDKAAIVISNKLAESIFGPGVSAIGKQLKVDHLETFHVTGVFKAEPRTSDPFDFALSYEAYKDHNKWLWDWKSNGPATYILIKQGTDPIALGEKIKDFIKTKNPETHIKLFLQKYSELYLHGRYENGKQVGGRIEYVNMFSIVAVVILLIACVNFMNLSTAQASRKAKEVGIKKAVGAGRSSLVAQYFTETAIISTLALGASLLFVLLLLPIFNIVTYKQMELHLLDPKILTGLLSITLITGLVAGSYPAIFLSGFEPAKVLKGQLRGSVGELWARQGLVIFQFSVSVILIAAVLVIYNQIRFTQTKSLGYNRENLIRIPMEGKLRNNTEAFITEVKKIPGVVNAATIGHGMAGRNNNTSSVEWTGKYPEEKILFENMRLNYETFELMEFELVDGRAFSRQFAPDTARVIFNEAAIRAMNLENPVGQMVKVFGNPYEIIGVAKDFHYQSLHSEVNPLFMVLNEANTWNIMVRLEGSAMETTLKQLSDLYTTFNPGFAFNYLFQDDVYSRLYSAEQRVATLANYFAVFAVLISCLGLFGLASHTTERRFKEMGIRKAMGSSVTNIVLLLTGEFTSLVVLGILLGLPVSYWLLSQWLHQFKFHIDLSLWYFVIAALVAIVIAWLTVASKAMQAARVNPVECLRIER
jgi:ABC-type antimicrobial peptide transport system permease subunit